MSASAKKRSKQGKNGPKLGLQTKLALWLAFAGLVPLVAVSAFSLKTVTDSLNTSIKKDTKRNLNIAMNLLLRRIQQTAADVNHLSYSPDVQALFKKPIGKEVQPTIINKTLDKFTGEVAAGLIELATPSGHVFARHSLGSPILASRLAAKDRSDIILKGLDYEHEVDLCRMPNETVVRAVAPVIDSQFHLLGVIMLSLPLDYHMAELLKATLGTHTLFYVANAAGSLKPVASSIATPNGKRYRGFYLSSAVAHTLGHYRSAYMNGTAFGGSYSLGIMPLVNAGNGRGRKLVGALAVAVNKHALVQSRRRAYQTTFILALLVLAAALAVAYLAAKGLTRPLSILHRSAMDVAQGDMDTVISVGARDEIGDLAEAFNYMTASLRQNQRRLAARVSEIIILHTIGRAITSVVDLDRVIETAVNEVKQALGADVVVLFLTDPDQKFWLSGGAGVTEIEADTWEATAAPILPRLVSVGTPPMTCADVASDHSDMAKFGRKLNATGSFMLVPIEHQGSLLGVMILNRRPPVVPFGDGELRLLGTLADQVGTAIINAMLYEEVRAFNERLEQMVEERTSELKQANAELARTLENLKQTQAELILSERLAGMGTLVAGIAHEINNPAGAIQGAIETIFRRTERLADLTTQLLDSSVGALTLEVLTMGLHDVLTAPPPEVAAMSSDDAQEQRLAELLKQKSVPRAQVLARRLASADAVQQAINTIKTIEGTNAEIVIQIIAEAMTVRRDIAAIDTSIRTINRIVSALRSYSHLDQTRIERTDVHEGIETTLVILNNRLKYNIKLIKKYGKIPKVLVYADELNQVWTNLITNATDAIEHSHGSGTITIETARADNEYVVVRIIDDGPGISADVLPRIFKPFFTTKPKGRGTGLGLGIVERIVSKHGGRIDAESRPGRTCFSVYLPMNGPPTAVSKQGPTDQSVDAAG
ncbi:MAG: GAF domain-containing protein [Deltaproteobacteria bacterium]|nr:GAF domain-containing protein [Deltaproteobacteria bacterium]